MWRSAAEQVATIVLIITTFMATFCGRSAVAVKQCSTRAIAYFAAFLMFSFRLSAWGLASGVLVLRADQETLLDEIKARRTDTFVERTLVESHQLIGAI